MPFQRGKQKFSFDSLLNKKVDTEQICRLCSCGTTELAVKIYVKGENNYFESQEVKLVSETEIC